MWLGLIPVAVSLLAGADFGDVRNLDAAYTKARFSPVLYRSLEEWQARRVKLREQILSAAGMWASEIRAPLQFRRFGRVSRPDYTVERVVFAPFPGYSVAGNLYLPIAQHRVPAVLVPHGHWKHGRVHDEDDYSVPELCANLAMQGYAAFAYDMVGYNDTRQLPHQFGNSTTERLWSFHPMGLQLRTSMRAVDLLESLPEVDASRIAVTGASGGGTQTILLAAVDDRIRVSAPVVMVSATFQGDDACEMAPGLRVNTNNVEISAMAAPRPML